MPVENNKLSERIRFFRTQSGMSQEKLAEEVGLSRENINRFEAGTRVTSVETLVKIANALKVSADDLLVDSLEHSVSTADSEIHKLLLDCNEKEETILTKVVKAVKEILYAEGI